MTVLRLALVLVACGLALAPAGARAQTSSPRVTIGYQLIVNPWKVAIANGAFERATGWRITWKRFDSGAVVLSALAAGEVQIALAGSSPIAAGLSRGLDIELFWIAEDIAAAEALVVRNGARITAPQDLRGKTIAVPFASTSHFHTLFALEQFGIPRNEVRLVDMQPPEIAKAWKEGTIDAAFVWEPVLGALKATGRVLITSGLLSEWGKATFDGLISDRKFAAQHPVFMCRFVKTLGQTVESYIRDPAAWTPDSPEVQAIVSLIGGDPAEVPAALGRYRFPTLAEQATPRWLDGGRESGAARALRFTAKFLKEEKQVPSVLGDYSRAVNPRWVEMARSGGC